MRVSAYDPAHPEVRIREYRRADAPAVGKLIASTYAGFNLAEFSEEVRTAMLGPFANAASNDPEHRREITAVLGADILLVAEDGGEIIGVLRGRQGRLQSLFVSGGHHRRGIGTRLVERFERRVRAGGGGVVKVAATLFAVPFYQEMGYRKTTGPRRLKSFQGDGLPFQPMQKMVSADAEDGGRPD
ncbi:MAG: GNAT family N-acetyltransferase [Acidimicrobiia bacterium]|nr:GNAT family N-acetyltransferase [Acidimicrobiia bacterium]